MSKLKRPFAYLVVILVFIAAIPGCEGEPQSNFKNETAMTITTDTLKRILDAFNRHDLDEIMEYFAEDCSFDFPRGPEPYGQRFEGKRSVREALAGRFKGIPDVHYGNDDHWVSRDGKKGVSEWTLTGTTTSGSRIEVRGCDLWEFDNGKLTRKNSFWKIVEPPPSVTKP